MPKLKETLIFLAIGAIFLMLEVMLLAKAIIMINVLNACFMGLIVITCIACFFGASICLMCGFIQIIEYISKQQEKEVSDNDN